MDATATREFEVEVSLVLENCLRKIAGVLNKDFDPLKPKCVSLFRLFCSSIKTRNLWLKSMIKGDGKKSANQNSPVSKTNGSAKPKFGSIPVDKALSFPIPKKTGKDYEHPIRPEHLKSGLLIKQ